MELQIPSICPHQSRSPTLLELSVLAPISPPSDDAASIVILSEQRERGISPLHASN